MNAAELSKLDFGDMIDVAYEATAGRLGCGARNRAEKAEIIVAMLEEYVSTEDEIPESFDSEDFQLSKAVAVMRDELKELKERTAKIAKTWRSAAENGFVYRNPTLAKMLDELESE